MKILTFGEIMLRLKAPGHERFFQSPMLEATFGGGEANVAVSLANYGMDAGIPDRSATERYYRHHPRAALFRRGHKKIVRGEGRTALGIYYLEGGANQLPSKVVYDRAHILPLRLQNPVISTGLGVRGCGLVPYHGYHPGHQRVRDGTQPGVRQGSKEAGITVSCDLNFRKNLWRVWQEGQRGHASLQSMSMAIASEEDVQKSLNYGRCETSNPASWTVKSTARSATKFWKPTRT